jgi:predicted Zn-dependent protease
MTRITWIDKYLEDAEAMIVDGQVKEGLGILNNLLYEEPGYAYLHNHLGWAYLNYTTDEARAILHLNMAIKFDPMYAPPYLHLGSKLMEQEKYADALQYLQRGTQAKEAYKPAFLETMARAYELQGEYKKAIHTYKEALASSTGYESNRLMEGIKRCRNKRWALLFRKANSLKS